MAEKCIGIENKTDIKNTSDRVKELENAVKDLQHEVSSLQKNKVDSDTIHKMDIKLLELSRDIGEMKNNRTEDREAIKSLNESVEEVSSRLEEYLENNAKVLVNQMLSQKEQESLKESIDLILNEMKRMNSEIKNSNIWSQIKIFYSKSKFNKWVCRFTGLMIIIL
jgi:chromosome segregation ATPase